MRKILAILACKIAAFAGRLLGKGSSMPGKVALRICPDILARLALPKHIIAVTGSNGKTTTVELLVAALEANGLSVCWNKEGANQIEGIATTLLRRATLSGKVAYDAVVMETDEQYARHTFPFIQPSLFAVLNLYRDQMTRNGHPEYIFNRIAEAITPETNLLLNADDPQTALLAPLGKNVLWFGAAGGIMAAEKGVYDDGKHCLQCGRETTYTFRHFAAFGGYACEHCGHARPKPDYEATAWNEETGAFTVSLPKGGEIAMETGLSSPYSLYNMLAAFAMAVETGVPAEKAGQALSAHKLQSGRAKRWNIDGKDVWLFTSKHENSVSYDRSLALAARRGGAVLVLVDAVSRKYFTGETSWLWDIDFNRLAVPQVEKVILAGRYVYDMAERFSFTDISPEKIVFMPELEDMTRLTQENKHQPLTVVTCFSDRDKFIRQLPPEASKEAIS